MFEGTSTPWTPKRYFARKEPEPLVRSGAVWRLYYEDGEPKYMAAETLAALRNWLLSFEPDAIIEVTSQDGG